LYGPVFERNQRIYGVKIRDSINKDQLESKAEAPETACGLRAST